MTDKEEALFLGRDDVAEFYGNADRMRLTPEGIAKAKRQGEVFSMCRPQTGINNAYCRACGGILKWDVPRLPFLYRLRGLTEKGFLHVHDCTEKKEP
jgi:hypothetical protein